MMDHPVQGHQIFFTCTGEPNEWCLIELQGSIENSDKMAKYDNLTLGNFSISAKVCSNTLCIRFIEYIFDVNRVFQR
jgi:hypothetical protein